MLMALSACGGGRDPGFELAGTFRFSPVDAGTRVVPYALSGEPKTGRFPEVEVRLAWRDDYPRSVLLRNSYLVNDPCGYDSFVAASRVSVTSGDSVDATLTDAGVRLTMLGPGVTVLRQEGMMRCRENRTAPYSHDIRVRVEAIRGFEIAAFPECEGKPIPSELALGAPPVFVLGAEGGRFIAANAPTPPGLVVRAPGGYRDSGRGDLEYGAGRLEWSVEGDAPVTGVLSTVVAGPWQAWSAKATWAAVVERGGKMGSSRTELPSKEPLPVRPAGSARLELHLDELATQVGLLCRHPPTSWFEAKVESGPCEAVPPQRLSESIWLANFRGNGRCVISAGMRGSAVARWTAEATTVAAP